MEIGNFHEMVLNLKIKIVDAHHPFGTTNEHEMELKSGITTAKKPMRVPDLK